MRGLLIEGISVRFPLEEPDWNPQGRVAKMLGCALDHFVRDEDISCDSRMFPPEGLECFKVPFWGTWDDATFDDQLKGKVTLKNCDGWFVKAFVITRGG